MSRPRLTIVIPTHNRPDLLPRAIDSALRQTEPVHVIVADDGDFDANDRAINGARVEHIATVAKTPWQNWKAGAEAATTELVAWHQDDDVVRPTYARRIIEAFDRFPDANLWLSRLQVSQSPTLALWNSGNGPWVPMDFMSGFPSSYAEGSILASTAYFISWSLSPAVAFRNGPAFHDALQQMPDNCDIFVERLIPMWVANGGPFIADPVIAGYWIQHGDHLSAKQHPDQPRQTKWLIYHVDEALRHMPGWQDTLKAWCQVMPSPQIIQWIGQIDHTIKEGGTSWHARKVQEILVLSLVNRCRFGRFPRWWHKVSRWLRDRVAL